MRNEQELAMSEFLYNMTHEGKKLAAAYRELEKELIDPAGEILDILESKENIDLSLDELKEKASHLTEEGRSKDYEELPVTDEEIEAERVRAEAAGEQPRPAFYDIHSQDAGYDYAMHDRYQKAIDFKENVESNLNIIDNELKKMTDALNKIKDAGVIDAVKDALKEAEANRRPGNDADKAYVDSLQDFVNFYDYYADLVGGFRTKIADRKAKFDNEFDASRQAIKDNNEKYLAEIEAIRAQVRPLEAKKADLEIEIRRKERRIEFDEEYDKLIEQKKELENQINGLNHQIGDIQKNKIQKMPTFDYNFDLYTIEQRDLIDLSSEIEKFAPTFSDLEQQMEKYAIDARDRAPRFEYKFDIDGNLIATIVVNGSAKHKTVGNYKDLSYAEISYACRQLVFGYAASSTGLNADILGRFPFMVAQKTEDGLVFAESKENNTFKITGVAKVMADAVAKRKEDDMIISNNNPEPTPDIDDPSKNNQEPTPDVDDPSKNNQDPTPDVDDKDNDKDNKEDYGFKCASSRDFKIKVGNANDQTRLGNTAQNRNYESLLKDRFARKLINPSIAAIGAFAAISVPTLPVIVAAGGIYTIANLLGHSPEIIEMARRHKLNKLAKKLGVEIGYKIDKDNYQMAFIDSEGRALSNEEMEAIAKGKGIVLNNDEFTGELDKIAGNKFRSKNYKEKYAKKEFAKFKNNTIKKINDYAYDFGLELDLEALNADGEFVFKDISTGQIIKDEDLEKEVQDAKSDFEKEYDEGVKQIATDEYVGKLLISKKARKLNALSDVAVVKPENLIALYDDIGGITLKGRGRNKFAKFIKRRLDKIVATFDLEAQVKQNILSKAEDLDADDMKMDKAEVDDTKDQAEPVQPIVDEPVPGDTPEADDVDKNATPDTGDVDKTDAPDVDKTEPAPSVQPVGLDLDSAAAAVANMTAPDAALGDDKAAGPVDNGGAADAATAADNSTADATATADTTAADTSADGQTGDAQADNTQDDTLYNEAERYLARAYNDGNFDQALAQLMEEKPELAERYVVDHPIYQDRYNVLLEKLNQSDGLGL